MQSYNKTILYLANSRKTNGRDPRVLDIIRITMIEPRTHAFQTENHLIDTGYYWSLLGRATWRQALAAVDGTARPLWDNMSSSYSGRHDRMAEADADPAKGSLRLIEVNDLEVCVEEEGAEFGDGKRKVRGRFTHGGVKHYLSITAPSVERRYLRGQGGAFRVGHVKRPGFSGGSEL